MKYLIVGAGLSGAVLAERIASKLGASVTVIEKRDHIGGNCYDYVDTETGIRLNKYGPHLFHTNNQVVWDYVNSFVTWTRWEHKVLASVDGKYVPMPVCGTTINELCGTRLRDSDEVAGWLRANQVVYTTVQNSEEMAKSRIGTVLYEKLVKEYTFKQWGRLPAELDKSVLERIPVRPNFDVRYFGDKYQGLPEGGYTYFFEKLLSHPNIEVLLNTDYFEFSKGRVFDAVIFTGPIDAYFHATGLEKLEYRSMSFSMEVIKNMKQYQPNSVVNYPNINVPYTRIVEYKHFLNQQSDHTIIVKETPTDVGEPYYPVPSQKNLDLYEKYRLLASREEMKNVYFVGRLANYKYFNMDEAVWNSLQFFESLPRARLA